MDLTTSTADVPALLADGAAAVPDAPLLTWCDDATGERVALSAADLAGWAARTAGLLLDGCGLGAGSRVAVLLPPHWQTAAVLLGAWSAGLSVSFRPRATAGLPQVGPGADAPMDAVFAAADRVDDWLEDVPDAPHRFVLGLAPAATPTADVPAGYRDYLTEVRRHTAHLPAHAPLVADATATVDGTSYREWGSLATMLAERLDLRAGDRLLVDVAEQEHPVKWLLAPLSVGASVVLCAHLDRSRLADRLAAEQATHTM